LFGNALVLGTKALPDSFPVEAVMFDTLVKATISNITATTVRDVNKDKSNDANSPGKD
jgi:hypothetical protein